MLTTAGIGAIANATGADSTTFKITDKKLDVPAVTLSAEDNVKLVKQVNERFKRSVYWNKYKVTDNTVVEIPDANEEKHIRELLESSYQGVKRLFVLAYDNTAGKFKFLVILAKNISLQELKLKTAASKLIQKTLMILMT